MAQIETFSTDGAPLTNRARLFQERMVTLFSVGLIVKTSETAPLRTKMQAYCGSRLQFADLHFSPHITSSGQGNSVASSRLLVTLQKEGGAVFSQDGRESHIEPGDIVLIDPSRPFRIETGEIRTQSVYLEPSGLRTLFPKLEKFTALPIKTSVGESGAMFRAMVNEMFNLAPTLREETADRIADALPYVLATALSLVEQDEGLLPSKLKFYHKQRILRFVRDNIRDNKLDARMIAEGVDLSLRYIYELFSDESEALMKWVWSERLNRCRRDLEMTSLKNHSIGEIAYGWGFSDVAHFSRTFRARFDLSPREYRRKSLMCQVTKANIVALG